MAAKERTCWADAYKEEEECVVDLVTDEEAGPTDDEVRDSSNSPLFLFPGPTFADAYKVAEEDIVDLVTDEEATDVEVATASPSIKTEPGTASEGTLKIEAVYSGKDDVAMAMAQAIKTEVENDAAIRFYSLMLHE
jgi:hypothetical protein